MRAISALTAEASRASKRRMIMIKEIEFRACIAPIMSGIRTGGDGLRLTLDIPESDVKDAIALIALRNVPLIVAIKVDNSPVATRIQRPDDKPAKKEKKPKVEKPGTKENGRYWNAMKLANYYAMPGLEEVLALDGNGSLEDAVAEAIRLEFNVASRRQISPELLEKWAEGKGLAGLVSVSRGAAIAAERKAKGKASQ